MCSQRSGCHYNLSMIKITIITICLNAESTLQRAIESVLAQTYLEKEYVVVDGLSTDATPKIIEQYREKINRYIREPDEGLYHAMNKGIAASTGDIINFLNADDIFCDHNVLNDVADVFNADQSLDLVYGDIVRLKDNRESYHSQNYTVTRNSLARRTIHHQSIIARKKLFDEQGLFNQKYRVVSDYEWILKVFLSSNYRCKHIPRPIAFFSIYGRSANEKFEHERRVVMKGFFNQYEILRYRAVPLLIERLKNLVRSIVRKIKKFYAVTSV